MITYTHKALMKIIVFAAIICSALLLVGWMVGSTAHAPTDREKTDDVASEEQGDSRVKTITASSSLEADMDAYLESSDSAPNPGEFNDSYSDLNR